MSNLSELKKGIVVRSVKAKGNVYYMAADTIEEMSMEQAIDLHSLLKKEGLRSFMMDGKEYAIEELMKMMAAAR